MILLRVQLQELLHADVGKAERVGSVPLITGGVYLYRRAAMSSEGPNLTFKTTFKPKNQHKTHPDPFHHEADVANAHEVCALIDSINRFDMTGDLK